MLIVENKWVRGAIPALLIHSCIGSVYCWSLLKESISKTILIPVYEIEISFMLAIFCLGMSASFCGNLVEKNVKLSSFISTLCFSLGLIGSALAIYLKIPILLYIMYGIIMGIGLGIGYLSPIKTLMLWFKDNPGLSTGIAISGFGLSKVLFSPFIEFSIPRYGIEITLLLMSIYSIISMSFATYLIKKPKNWVENISKFSLVEVLSLLKRKRYIIIWLMFFINITCGLVIISFEKPVVSLIPSLLSSVAIISSCSAGFNTLGRFGYSTLSDYLNKKYLIYSLIFFTSFLSCFLVYLFGFNLFTCLTIIFIINLGYGGGFSTLPVLLRSEFGMKKISTIHGLTLSAWAWASVASFGLTQLFIYKLNLGIDNISLILSLLYMFMFILSLTFLKK